MVKGIVQSTVSNVSIKCMLPIIVTNILNISRSEEKHINDGYEPIGTCRPRIQQRADDYV